MATKILPTLLAVATALTLAAPASAKIVHVAPGPGTPLQDAIDAAAPGDTLRLAFGSYPESIVVTKPLKILGNSSTIDAQCAAATAVTVAADKVWLERLWIVGATLSQVAVDGRDRVTLRSIRSMPTCEDVEHAVDATAATRLTITKSSFYSYREDLAQLSCPDASARSFAIALRIGATPPGGLVRVTNNYSCQADVGILVEDAADAPRALTPVKVERNVVYVNGRGIVLRSSDGTLVRANEVQSDGDETVGIEVEAGSDENLLVRNKVQGYPTDVSDAGTSNCWRANAFTTGSVPATGCP